MHGGKNPPLFKASKSLKEKIVQVSKSET